MPENQNALPAVLIPGFDAGACLSIASELLSKGFSVIATCGEGDSAASRIAANAGCAVIKAHDDDAIHAGLEYFHSEMKNLPGVVFVNVKDGYAINDILAVAYVLAANPTAIVLASRSRNKELNRKERLVKSIAGRSFIVHGRTVRDPWVGLIALPSGHMHDFLIEKGKGHEYIFNIILMMQRHGIKAVTVPVGTQYRLPDNMSFGRRAKDIFRILFLPFKFISASMAATGLDYLIFLLFLYAFFPGRWVVAMLAGRTTGGVAGYFLNRGIVFRHKNDSWRKELKSAFQFTLLFLFNLGASMSLVYLLHDILHINEVAARLVVDAFLFTISYTVQREIIFRRKSPNIL